MIKILEIEMKKVQSEIQDICKSFDEKLKEVQQLGLFVSYSILAQELFILRLGQGLFQVESLEAQSERLLESIEKAQVQVDIAMKNTQQLAGQLEDCRDEYNGLLDQEKAQDKSFVREIEQVASGPLDQDTLRLLTDLYKRRKLAEEATPELGARRLKSKQKQTAQDDELMFDPFRDLEIAREKRNKNIVVLPLDSDFDRPENVGVDDHVWEQLITLRDRKIELEKDTATKLTELNDLKDVYEDFLQQEQIARDKYEKLQEDRDKILDELERSRENSTFMVPLKQGQDETVGGDPRKPVTDAYLINRSLIESLNERILRNGNEQVGILTKIKNFRKSIKLES